MSSVVPVILDHDGGVDDIAALAILVAAPHHVRRHRTEAEVSNSQAALADVRLIGVIATDADCFVDPAVECSIRVISLACLGLADADQPPAPVPVAASSIGCRGPAAFPDDWRKDANHMLGFASLNATPVTEAVTASRFAYRDASVVGEELLASLVMASSTPVTICVTGPLSNVAYCIDKYGERFTRNVGRLVIMGGAVNVPGNVFLDGCDGSAEWNIFWDPQAAATVVSTPLLRPEQKVFMALDATNDVPVTMDFVKQFAGVTTAARRPAQLARFLGECWSMCTIFSRVFDQSKGYFAWDALTAAFVVDASVCEAEPPLVRVSVNVDLTSPSCGRTFVDEAHGALLVVPRRTNADKFYELTLSCASCV